MRCGFQPRDRDRTTERMEGVRKGFGPLWMGVGLQHTHKAFTVARLTVGVSNELQMTRNLTGGLPFVNQGCLANLGPIRERLTPTHEKRQKRALDDIGVSDRKTDNRENAWMHETNTYANAMNTMT